MQKFTIFLVVLSVILLIVVAELANNDYFNKEDNLNASIFGNTTDPTKSFIEDFQNGISREDDEKESGTSPKINPLTKKKHITNEFLSQANFNDPNIIEAEFNGKFFDFLNLADVGLTDVQRGEIYEKDKLAGEYFEIRLENIDTAKETYTLIKEKAKGNIDITINETNSYGENSFYINMPKTPDEAYLSVRIRNYVYGFKYDKDNHKKFTDLIKIL